MHFYETSFLFGQVQNTKHPSLHHGVVSLHSHALQISLGPAGGQVRTPQVAGERHTHKQPPCFTLTWTGTHWGSVGAADGGVHQAGADGVCHRAASAEEDQTGGKHAAAAAEALIC